MQLSKLDARMMRHLSTMQQMEVKLELASMHDYRSILVPLVKSFMRARLEDLAEKDATEKSDAAREAFLAELALDSKKGTVGGNDSSKHVHDKTKEKKKNKEHRKPKDSKGTGGNEFVVHHETEKPVCLPDGLNGGHSDSEAVVPLTGNSLKQEEEEFRRRIELEAEERKLEETLENQRRIEDEAKQKHLAEQHKKTIKTLPDSEAVVPLTRNSLKQEEEEFRRRIELEAEERERLAQRDELLDGLESVPANSTDKTAQKIVLPNGGVHEDGISSSDRRTGRKNRRLKNSPKLVDAKHPTMSSEKENPEIGQVRANETKTLRQLQAEEDDEERFQADLKKAVRQSLDTFHAHQRLPLISTSRMSQKMSSEVVELGISGNEVVPEAVNGLDVHGTGLKNEVGEYNCFLNVIIQSLWHLRRFREEFMRRSMSEHVHVGDPCVTCALYDIFAALSIASTDLRKEAVAPTSLRIALSNLYPDSNFFQEAQMNDASEVLGVIFDCLHRSFTSTSGVSDTESVESGCTGLWDCANAACIAHSLFGMDIFERMNCYSCGLESRHLKYTSFFHNINASALRTMKVMCADRSFDELLNLVEMNHQLACDPEAGGCGKLNYIHHILSSPPCVFTAVVGWQNTCESAEDITATLASLATEMDIAVLYRGLDPKNRYCLVSVVCYYGQHYHCFAYSPEHECWVMYDDRTVKVIGGWDDVLTMCERGHLQPQVLFFEAVN
ncbi:Ubiquitinyl hydrolase 1 [Bertholletia excelsa]